MRAYEGQEARSEADAREEVRGLGDGDNAGAKGDGRQTACEAKATREVEGQVSDPEARLEEQFRVRTIDNADDEIAELLQRVNDRLTPNNLNIAKRYVETDFDIRHVTRCRERYDWHAVFERMKPHTAQ